MKLNGWEKWTLMLERLVGDDNGRSWRDWALQIILNLRPIPLLRNCEYTKEKACCGTFDRAEEE